MGNDIATRQESNLALWEKVEKTLPGATKTSRMQGREVTTIDGYRMIEKATSVFGPLGIGWGYDIVEERFDVGAPFGLKQEDGSVVQVTGLTHTIKLKLWYKWQGEKGEVTQYGHTASLYRSKYGASDDGEAPKKSTMDAIKKALSMLGFSADVYTGQFEDASYVSQLKTEEEINKAEDQEKEITTKQAELSDYVTRHLDIIDSSKSEREVKGIAATSLRHLERQKMIECLTKIAERGITAIARKSEDKIKELKND